eukprot:5976310-Alexandrium_andersonii.AAC.1
MGRAACQSDVLRAVVVLRAGAADCCNLLVQGRSKNGCRCARQSIICMGGAACPNDILHMASAASKGQQWADE